MAQSVGLSNRLIGLQAFKESVWGTVGAATSRLMAVKPTPEFTPIVKSTILDEQRHSLIPGFNSYVGMRGGAFTFGGIAAYEEMMAFALGAIKGGVVAAPAAVPATIASSTNATPVEVTTATAHGLTSGDIVTIASHLVNTNANGTWSILVTSPTTFTLTGSVGNGVGGATGTLAYPLAGVAPLSIASSTNVSPIEITTSGAHGLATGAQVVIAGHLVNTNANGPWYIIKTGANTFTLTGSVGNGVGGATGTVGLTPFVWAFAGPDAAGWNPQSFTYEHAYDIATIQAAGCLIQKLGIKGDKDKAWEYTLSGFYKQHNQITPLAIASSTPATPIAVTTVLPHGLVTGNSVYISGHLVNTAANGYWNIVVTSPTSFTLTGSISNGTGINTGTVEMVLTQSLPGRQIEAILFPTTQMTIDDIGGVNGKTLLAPGVLQSFNLEIEDGLKEFRGQGSLYPTDFVYEVYKASLTLHLLFNPAVKALRTGLYAGSGKTVRLKSASGAKAAQIDFAGVLTSDPKEYTNTDGAVAIEVKLEAMYDSGSLANFFAFTDTCGLAVLP